jgi:leucyl/phenylalanyl-tRNA--protein transferase
MPIYRLSNELIFPDPARATAEGLLAVGGDLSVARLELAYRLGIFPWYGEHEPILWWSPDPRCVLFPPQVHVSRRLERRLRQGRFSITCDRAFAAVVRACADVRLLRGEQTWLITEMQQAYAALYEAGFAHSVEAWDGDDLVGGLYGVAMGRCYFGESMFHLRTDASKAVLVALARWLERAGFELLDCQVSNPHLLRMGACHIPRVEFLAYLARAGLGPEGEGGKVCLPEKLPI